MTCTKSEENRMSLSQKTIKKPLHITNFGQNVSISATRGSSICAWILTKFGLHFWSMSKLRSTKRWQSRSRTLPAMAFFVKKGKKKSFILPL